MPELGPSDAAEDGEERNQQPTADRHTEALEECRLDHERCADAKDGEDGKAARHDRWRARQGSQQGPSCPDRDVRRFLELPAPPGPVGSCQRRTCVSPSVRRPASSHAIRGCDQLSLHPPLTGIDPVDPAGDRDRPCTGDDVPDHFVVGERVARGWPCACADPLAAHPDGRGVRVAAIARIESVGHHQPLRVPRVGRRAVGPRTAVGAGGEGSRRSHGRRRPVPGSSLASAGSTRTSSCHRARLLQEYRATPASSGRQERERQHGRWAVGIR